MNTRKPSSALPAATRLPALLAMLAGSAVSHNALAQSTDPFPAAFELFSLLPTNGGNGSDGFVLNGIDQFDSSGRSVSSAGDVNGDGTDDLVIGADGGDPNGNFYARESYVVFGGAGVGSTGNIELSSLNGSNGFVLNGIDANDLSGGSVSSAGDVNGDGFGDLIIGASFYDRGGNRNTGESYLVFGATNVGAGGVIELSSLNGSNGFVLNGIDQTDTSGWSVSSAGDVNSDGIDDLIIGAPFATVNGASAAGESYVVFGRDLSSCLADLNGDSILDLGDIQAFVNLFLASNLATDFNADGFLDIGDISDFVAAFLAGC